MDSAPIKNEFMHEKFLLSIWQYWKSRTTEENPWVFITKKQFDIAKQYSHSVSRFIYSYDWDEKAVFFKSISSKKGVFYLVNFESKVTDHFYAMVKYFVSNVSEENSEQIQKIFIAILEECETDLVSEKAVNEEFRKTVNSIYTICTEAILEIMNKLKAIY